MTEIDRRAAERPFRLVANRAANRAAPWTAAQDAILNERAFSEARETITGWPAYAPTPVERLTGLAAELGVAEIAYKDEGGRFGLGSFKALGGAYAVLRLLARRTGAPMAEILAGGRAAEAARVTVCCATDGNHGRSVAWGARTFGCRCVIFIHATVSEGRKAAIAAYGAEVRRCTGNYDDSVREAQETAAREGWFVVSDTSYPGYLEVPKDVMQGYEVMAWEAFEAMPAAPTHIFLQTGVGGMAAAVAAHAKRRWGPARPTIVLADPAEAACWVESYRDGRETAVAGDLDTLMAGLACGEVSTLAWQILSDHADWAMAVPDEGAVEFMRRLACPPAPDRPLVAGESATAGLAALAAARADGDARAALGLGREARVLVFGSEGDTDPGLYVELVGAEAAEIRARAA